MRNIKNILWQTRNTFFPHKEMRHMTRYLKKNYKHDLIGVEIGVQYADNALRMLYNLPIKKLYLVDPYSKYKNYDSSKDGKWVDVFEQGDFDKMYNTAKNKVKHYGDKVEFVVDLSENAADKISDNLDFVYIDGNHKYEYVLKDLELYYPKVKKGGVIGGHDWHAGMDVWKAANDFIKKHNLDIDGRFDDWWIVKKEGEEKK